MQKIKKRPYSRLDRKEALAGYLFILPNFLGFALLTVFPIFFGFFVSLTDYNGFNKMNLIGFDNFVAMFNDPLVATSLKNNFFYTFTMVPLSICFALLVAVLIHSKILKSGNFFRIILFFPNITSSIAVGIIWRYLFNPSMGPINGFLYSIGITDPPMWLAASSTAMITIVIVAVWQSLGFNMILLLAGLQGIPAELYDAAEVDGAVGWKRFTKITLPMLSPTLFFVSTMAIINSFKVFELIFQMTQATGGPGVSTNVMVFRIYNEGFKYMKFGYASAQAMLLFAIILVFTAIQFGLQKFWVFDENAR